MAGDSLAPARPAEYPRSRSCSASSPRPASAASGRARRRAVEHAIPTFDSAPPRPPYVNAIFLPVIVISGVFHDAENSPALSSSGRRSARCSRCAASAGRRPGLGARDPSGRGGGVVCAPLRSGKKWIKHPSPVAARASRAQRGDTNCGGGFPSTATGGGSAGRPPSRRAAARTRRRRAPVAVAVTAAQHALAPEAERSSARCERTCSTFVYEPMRSRPRLEPEVAHERLGLAVGAGPPPVAAEPRADRSRGGRARENSERPVMPIGPLRGARRRGRAARRARAAPGRRSR